MAEKKVLVDVEIKATEALENLAKLKIRVNQLKEEQKVLREEQKISKPTNDEELQAYQEKEFKLAEVAQQIKHQSTLIRSYEKEIQNNIIAEKAQGDSLDALKAKLSLATAEYNSLSKAARQDAYGLEKAKEIKQLTDELTEAETSLGNFHRQVGHYELAGKGLRTTLKELTEELTIMKLEGRESTEEYKKMAVQLADFKDAMGDVQNEAKGAASDTSNLDAMNQSLQGIVGTYGAYAAVMGISTEDNKEFEETLQKMQVAITAIVSLTAIQNTLQKDSIVYQKARIILDKVGLTQAKATAGAEAALNIIRGKATIGTKALAVAQLLWNKALLANPVVLLAAALVALVAGIVLVTKWMSTSSDATKQAEKAMNEYNQAVWETGRRLDILEAKNKNRAKADEQRGREEILRLKQNGASKEEIAKKESEIAQRKRDIEIKASKDIIREKEKEIKKTDAAIIAKRAEIAEIKYGTEEYNEQVKALNELVKARDTSAQAINDNSNSIRDKQIEAEEELQRKREEGIEKAKQAREKAFNDIIKGIDRNKEIQEKNLEYERLSKEKSFENDKNYEEKVFNLQQEMEKSKLETQKKYGKVTAQEYKDGLTLLSLSEKTFYKQREKDIDEAYKAKIEMLDKNIVDEEKALRKAAKKEQDDWVAIIEAKYDEAYKQTEAYAIERDSFIFDSELKLERDIQNLKRESIKKQIEDVEKAVKEQYDGDLQKYSDNEREKTKIEIAQLEESIKLKKEKGLSTYEDEAELRAAQTKLNQIALNTELLNENLTAQQRYELKKASIEAELELYRGNIDKEKELEAELAQAAKNYAQERINIFEEWAGKIMNLASELNNFTKALDDQELQEYEERNEQKKASYQEQLDSGIISKEQYDAKIVQSEQELDQKKAEIVRKQAIREKLLKAFEIAINTASAIMKAAPNIALQVLTGITGAAQLATVMATPIPKASRGMLLKGNSHAQGGTLIEAEGGEAIINKRSTMMYTPLLSAINQAGGGVAFDGGYAMRNFAGGGLSAKDIERIVEKTLSSQKIFVAVEDIRRGDKRFAKIESRGNW